MVLLRNYPDVYTGVNHIKGAITKHKHAMSSGGIINNCQHQNMKNRIAFRDNFTMPIFKL